jgi:hypothetical protein
MVGTAERDRPKRKTSGNSAGNWDRGRRHQRTFSVLDCRHHAAAEIHHPSRRRGGGDTARGARTAEDAERNETLSDRKVHYFSSTFFGTNFM